jgi:hypothetical protein
MSEKQQIQTKLSDIFSRWQELLAKLGEDQFTNPLVPSPWTVKDVIAHLWTWQQISVARMEAALHDREPNFPDWWRMFGPDPEEDVFRQTPLSMRPIRISPGRPSYRIGKHNFNITLN